MGWEGEVRQREMQVIILLTKHVVLSYTLSSPSAVVMLQGARSAHLMAMVDPAASS